MSGAEVVSDLDRAAALLKSNHYSCVLCRGDEVLTSTARGVAPLVDWLAEGVDMTGFSAADQVVGRAAGLLYIAAGIKRVHAVVASESARVVFADRDIEIESETWIPAILNRDRSGPCPMESAIRDTEDPAVAVERLTAALAAMRARTSAMPSTI